MSLAQAIAATAGIAFYLTILTALYLDRRIR